MKSKISESARKRSLEGLEGLRGLLETEEKEIRFLLDKNRELFEERRKREREEKKRWIIQKRMDRLGVSEEEAERDLEGKESLYKEGLESIYKLERELERCEEVRDECLRYMSLEDYNRITMLFLGGSHPPPLRMGTFRR